MPVCFSRGCKLNLSVPICRATSLQVLHGQGHTSPCSTLISSGKGVKCLFLQALCPTALGGAAWTHPGHIQDTSRTHPEHIQHSSCTHPAHPAQLLSTSSTAPAQLLHSSWAHPAQLLSRGSTGQSCCSFSCSGPRCQRRCTWLGFYGK